MAKQPKNKHAPGKAPKPPALKKPKKDTAPKRSHNLVDPEKAEAFRHDVEQWQALNAKAESAKDKLKAFEKGALKNDGFSVKMVKDAVLLATPEGQAQFRAEMAARLTTAAFLNMKIGEQLPLFLDGGSALSGDPEKRAYDEGQSASMANQPMKPPYDPDTKEYAAFAKGYHTHQEKLALGGISKMEKAKGATVAAEKGNWNSFDGTIPASESLSADMLPDSLYLSVKPAWFGDLSWPAITPHNPKLDLTIIPAGYRYIHNKEVPGAIQ
jgi:hypothetical protein